MPPLLRFLITRLGTIPVTLLIITAFLYGFVMLTPPSVRVTLYMGSRLEHLSEEQLARYIQNLIEKHHLDDPYPIQYAYWLFNLLKGNWGYSRILREDVLSALVRRTPVTAELTLYSLLLFIPLGLISGVLAGWKKNQSGDNRFRFTAFIATSLPPFVLALILISIFYVGLRWFPIERLSLRIAQEVRSPDFIAYTGLMTVDGFLNARPDISLDAFRHLVLPVVTLSLLHWATLGRVTRASVIEESQKEYVMAGRAHGIKEKAIVWNHVFRNALSPALTSTALAAASLFTGVFVVEVIYNFKGISDVVIESTLDVPDAPAVLGFAIYSVTVVLLLMLVLDIVQALLDPRIREGLIGK